MMRPFLISLATLALPALSHAAVLAEYQFAGGLPASTDADPLSIAQPFTISGGGGFSTAQNNVFKRSSETDGASRAEAIAANDYFSFIVEPLPGGELDLTQLAFDFGGTNDTSPTTGSIYPTNFAVMSSVGGFGPADPVLGTLSKTVPPGTSSTPQFDSAQIDLTFNGPQFQNLTAPVEFRIYMFDNANLSGQISRVDNLSLTGTATVVPEPATLSLLTLAALPLLRRRRK